MSAAKAMRRNPLEYQSWLNMRNRCLNKNEKWYPKYGGRGITICARWDSFDTFLADMGPRPPRTSLDRIANDGHYEPGNCRWATPAQQGANTSATIMVPIPLPTLARLRGINRKKLWRRLKLGWTVEEAIDV